MQKLSTTAALQRVIALNPSIGSPLPGSTSFELVAAFQVCAFALSATLSDGRANQATTLAASIHSVEGG